MRGYNFWVVYAKMWAVAEKIAETETKQFEAHPYADRVFLCEDGQMRARYDDVTREQYKDRKRWGHIDRMVTMYLSTEEEDAPAPDPDNEREHTSGTSEPGFGEKTL